MAAERDCRGDHGLVRPACLEDGHLVVDEVVRIPAEDRRAVRALPAVDSEIDRADPPGDPGRLEPVDREATDGDDLVLEHVGVGAHARIAFRVRIAQDLTAP